MLFFNFQDLPIIVNLGIFLFAAVVVWVTGTSVSKLADNISDRTRIGKAFVGFLLLALATNAPELGTTISAASFGNAALATNNMFGGIVFQTFILVLLDLAMIRGALTYYADKVVILIQGTALTLSLSLVMAAITSNMYLVIFGMSIWSFILIGAYIVSAYLINYSEKQWFWEPKPIDGQLARENAIRFRKSKGDFYHHWSLARVILFFGGGVMVIFIAGVVLANIADALAVQTGLGSSFIGVTLVAASTSLPELSVTLTAVRLGNFDTAVSNIFGSNSGMIVTLFLADAFYRDGAILAAADSSAHFNVAAGIAVTAIYLIGLLNRRNKTFMGMGYDSILVAICFIVTILVSYHLR